MLVLVTLDILVMDAVMWGLDVFLKIPLTLRRGTAITFDKRLCLACPK